jgi:hypothetical protein
MDPEGGLIAAWPRRSPSERRDVEETDLAAEARIFDIMRSMADAALRGVLMPPDASEKGG